MSASPVLVFPGQGAQAVGMGKDLADRYAEVRALFARADEVLGFPLTKIVFEGPEEALVDTAVQQPALVLVSLAALKALELKSGRPVTAAAAAGLSLGEYSALAAVGALPFDEALKLVRRRGELMKEASARTPSSMAVILKLDEAAVRAACEQAARETNQIVSPCNFNGGGQIVIGGQLEALQRAGELCKEAKGRAMPLKVAGAFHTALMQPAADGLKAALDAAPIRRAQAPVYANALARPVQEPDEIRAALQKQLTSPVLWEQSVLAMGAAGLTTFLELGAGKTVGNMIRKIAPDAQVANLGTAAELDAYPT
ncbi:MAG: ACP S-malonyltransferase [Planctomycetes bacterium]|nr:ACP S-malonyltransferase [Planctomycetota bacterium]